MPNLFTGWIGYGTAISGNTITEPADAGYARQPVIFSPVSPYGPSVNLQPFTLGNFVAGQMLTCAAIFDAVTGGNCIAFWPLATVPQPAAGATLTIRAGAINLALIDTPRLLQNGSMPYQAGQIIGTHNKTTPITAGINVTFRA